MSGNAGRGFGMNAGGRGKMAGYGMTDIDAGSTAQVMENQADLLQQRVDALRQKAEKLRQEKVQE